MKKSISMFPQNLSIVWAILLAAVLISITACSSTPADFVPLSPNSDTPMQNATEVSPNSTQASSSENTNDTLTTPQTTSNTVSPPVSANTTAPTIKVEVLYFHNNQRCATCLCFEERVTHVVTEYFKDQLAAGTLIYQVVNRQNEDNADLVKKYQPVGSQLFINTVINGIEHIVDVQDIWIWNCRGDPDQFDNNIQQLIIKSLTGAN